MIYAVHSDKREIRLTNSDKSRDKTMSIRTWQMRCRTFSISQLRSPPFRGSLGSPVFLRGAARHGGRRVNQAGVDSFSVPIAKSSAARLPVNFGGGRVGSRGGGAVIRSGQPPRPGGGNRQDGG